MAIGSKLPHVGTTIFTVMSRMASEEGAINLSQGFPGFGADPVLLELVGKYTRDGYNQYPPMSGIPQLRRRLAEKTELTQIYFPDPETEVTIVSGATEALFSAVTAVVRPGDEVVLLEPAYDSYEPAVTLNGGVPVYVPLNAEDFSVDWERVEKALSPKTRLIMVNSPHNPSGYVWTEEDIDSLATLVRDRDIYLVSDEVYEHITFDGRKHISLGSHPELRNKTFVCGSFGKTFHVTGWKIGYCIAPSDMTVEFRKIHQFLTFTTVTPIQYALAEYLEEPNRYLSIPAFYQSKRDLFAGGLTRTGLIFTPARGSFFQLASYGHLSQIGDRELAERMTRRLKVACIPVSVFYSDRRDDKFIRFCFAKEEAELFEALERLQGLPEIL
ncbi:aminotransferase class I/II-fold pyridoxal phosphate-dependent enzyme [Algoriphagus aestuariicola]|uniref:Aminotransferase class I/II-fold pyridoxal phosphate-dependent enzyme n=1 Tax=Algoriphagus aestuariicola TaxID=1852016 RepID=A0ABS3BNZ5_9BACT|nr:methionine aminotransferase [Algoriphagus aestuariicola]MBN7799971.1 aminotransferase class I/II-fold pyridoxal phosphate-dependent enzyme [Algoriphagus aestuariicola]